MFEMDVEFELIEVDCYGLPGFFIHFWASTGFLNRGVIKKGYVELQKVSRFKPLDIIHII